MTISEVARKFGLSADTLRYYEKQGLIPPVTRSGSGMRNYGESDLKWVEFICCMRSAGVSIEALEEYVSLFQKGNESIAMRKRILTDERAKIAQRISDLQAALERLDYKLEGYEQRMLSYEKGLYNEPD